MNMTHVALAISRRPRQELMSLPFLSHSCGKRKPPYFPRTDGRRRRLKSPRNNHFFLFPPLTCLFWFFSGYGEFPDPQPSLPSLPRRRSTCARMNRKWRRALAACSRPPSQASLSYCISKSAADCMENAEEARNAPLFEASVYTRGLLALCNLTHLCPHKKNSA